MVVELKFTNYSNFIIWHNRLGHPGSVMMRKIINGSCWHKLNNEKILEPMHRMLSRETDCAPIIG
jgi:hypothetical protein